MKHQLSVRDAFHELFVTPFEEQCGDIIQAMKDGGLEQAFKQPARGNPNPYVERLAAFAAQGRPQIFSVCAHACRHMKFEFIKTSGMLTTVLSAIKGAYEADEGQGEEFASFVHEFFSDNEDVQRRIDAQVAACVAERNQGIEQTRSLVNETLRRMGVEPIDPVSQDLIR